MTTLREHWENESNDPDICSWIGSHVREELCSSWRVSVFRDPATMNITVMVGNHEKLTVAAHLRDEEEFTLGQAVEAAIMRINESFANYISNLKPPFQKD